MREPFGLLKGFFIRGIAPNVPLEHNTMLPTSFNNLKH